MELSITPDYLRKKDGGETRTLEEICAILRGGGFRHADYMPDYTRPDWADAARRDRETLDRAGIAVEQSHAPFNRYQTFASREEFTEMFRRSFVCAQIMGAKFAVVHADEYHPEGRWEMEEILRFTYDYLAPAADYCRAHGMVMAVENVFEDNSWRHPAVDGKSRFTSRVEEQLAIIERFNDPCVRACWDFGHACCACGPDGMTDALRRIGKYVVCTHVHDNSRRADQHLIPFMGEIDWRSQMRALEETGYPGLLSFEFVYGRVPDALLGPWMKLVSDTGRLLDGMRQSFAVSGCK